MSLATEVADGGNTKIDLSDRIELRRFVVRSTNTGISAVVAPSGALAVEAPPGEEAFAIADVVPIAERTPYARLGDVFAWLAVATVAADLFARRDRSGSWSPFAGAGTERL